MTEITMGSIEDLEEAPYKQEPEDSISRVESSPKWTEIRMMVMAGFQAMPGITASDGTKEIKVITLIQLLELLAAVETAVPL